MSMASSTGEGQTVPAIFEQKHMELDAPPAPVKGLEQGMALTEDVGKLREMAASTPKLDSSSWKEQIAAAMVEQKHKGMVRTPKSVEKLLRDMASTKWKAQRKAAQDLGKLGPAIVSPEVLDWLVRLMHSRNEEVQKAAIEAVGRLGERAATSQVLDGLRVAWYYRSVEVQTAVVKVVRQLGTVTERVLDLLAIIMFSSRIDLLKLACQAMLDIEPPPLQGLRSLKDEINSPRHWWENMRYKGNVKIGLELLMGSSDLDAQQMAIEAVRRLRVEATPGVLKGLVQCMRSSNLEKQIAAVKAVGQLRHVQGEVEATTEVLEALGLVMGSSNSEAQIAAAEALGAFASKAMSAGPLRLPAGWMHATLEVLLRLIGSTDAGKQKAALLALAPLMATNAGEQLGEKASALPAVFDATAQIMQGASDSWEVHRLAAVFVGKLGESAATPEVVEGLVRLMRSSSWVVQWAAIKAVEQLGEKTLASLLPAVLDSTVQIMQEGSVSWEVHKATSEFVGKLGESAATPEVVEGLVWLMRSSNWEVQLAAIKAVEQLGERTSTRPEVIGAAAEILQKNSWRVHEAAGEFVRKLGEKAATVEVLESLVRYIPHIPTSYTTPSWAQEALASLWELATLEVQNQLKGPGPSEVWEAVKRLKSAEVREAQDLAAKALATEAREAEARKAEALAAEALAAEARKAEARKAEALSKMCCSAVFEDSKELRQWVAFSLQAMRNLIEGLQTSPEWSIAKCLKVLSEGSDADVAQRTQAAIALLDHKPLKTLEARRSSRVLLTLTRWRQDARLACQLLKLSLSRQRQDGPLSHVIPTAAALVKLSLEHGFLEELATEPDLLFVWGKETSSDLERKYTLRFLNADQMAQTFGVGVEAAEVDLPDVGEIEVTTDAPPVLIRELSDITVPEFQASAASGFQLLVAVKIRRDHFSGGECAEKSAEERGGEGDGIAGSGQPIGEEKQPILAGPPLQVLAGLGDAFRWLLGGSSRVQSAQSRNAPAASGSTQAAPGTGSLASSASGAASGGGLGSASAIAGATPKLRVRIHFRSQDLNPPCPPPPHDQTARIACTADFEISGLADSDTAAAVRVKLTTESTPGSFRNDSKVCGYFQEQVEVIFGPSSEPAPAVPSTQTSLFESDFNLRKGEMDEVPYEFSRAREGTWTGRCAFTKLITCGSDYADKRTTGTKIGLKLRVLDNFTVESIGFQHRVGSRGRLSVVHNVHAYEEGVVVLHQSGRGLRAAGGTYESRMEGLWGLEGDDFESFSISVQQDLVREVARKFFGRRYGKKEPQASCQNVCKKEFKVWQNVRSLLVGTRDIRFRNIAEGEQTYSNLFQWLVP